LIHLRGGKAEVQVACYFFIGQAVHIAHDQRNAQRGRETIENAGNQAAIVHCFELGVRSRSNAQIFGFRGRLCVDLHVRFSFLLLQKVQAVVNLDALQPMPERGAAFKSAQSKKGLYEYLLG
jgi:hypothetical protein